MNDAAIEDALQATGELIAAVDNSPASVHTQDLIALRPTATELDEAARWVVTQDASPEFEIMVRRVVEHVANATS